MPEMRFSSRLKRLLDHGSKEGKGDTGKETVFSGIKLCQRTFSSFTARSDQNGLGMQTPSHVPTTTDKQGEGITIYLRMKIPGRVV